MKCKKCGGKTKELKRSRHGRVLVRVRACEACLEPFKTCEEAVCPNCGSLESAVQGNIRHESDSLISRYRTCGKCLRTFKTFESREDA